MNTPFDVVNAGLSRGDSLAEIRRSLRPDSWEPLLKACATAVSFDRQLFDEVLRAAGGPDAPTLDRLVALEVVEPLPGEPGRHRLPDSDRQLYAKSWLEGWDGGPAPDGLAALERRLAEYWRAAGNESEEMRHLLPVDPPAALRLFDTLFAQADRERDFARCQDLLEVLADPDRVTLAGPQVTQRRRDRAGYVRVQSHWAVDYARCAQYLVPTGLLDRAGGLLDGSGSPVWQLFASPGMGKTMQVRWLVTRHCVLLEHDVPCARIDFDTVSPGAVGHHPWLVLLEAAAQFDRRWPQRPFGRLDSYRTFRSLLDRHASELSTLAAQSLETHDPDRLRFEITDAFTSRFNETVRTGPALLVCDTLEELLLQGGKQEAAGFLELLGQVLQACPGLRIVLAGRKDLREEVPEALASLGAVEHVEVKPFTEDEARTYLGKNRGIIDTGKCEKAVQRAHGRPLTLALFADAIVQDPELTAETLAEMSGPLIPLLIERVVRRIEDYEVRWLVRYGVVPRTLRKQDLFTVMRPFLQNMGGANADDDPRKDAHDLGGKAAYEFTDPPHDDTAVEEIWEGLLRYAGNSSWVTEVAGDPSTVRFHPDVLVPQRLIIADHPVFEQLHRAYARHFDALATDHPDRWAEHTCEAVYHRFQLGGPQAAAGWRAALRRARDRDALDDLRILASEVVREEYVDEENQPRPSRSGGRMVGYADLAESAVQRAYVIARQALRERARAADPQWSEVRSLLNEANNFRTATAKPLRASAQETALRSILLTLDGRAEDGADLARQALDNAGKADAADALRVLGDSRAAVGDPEAQHAYRRAYELAVEQGRTAQATDIALALAAERERHGKLDEALYWCEHAESDGEPTAWPSPAHLTRARLLMACHRPAAALALLRPWFVLGGNPVSGQAAEARAEGLLLHAQAQLMLGRGERALADLDRAAEATPGIPGITRYRCEARIHQLRGAVLGESLAVDEAERAFQRAESMWTDFGYSAAGHPECRFLYIRFLLRQCGDLVHARELLAADRRAPAERSGPWTTSEDEFLLRTELLEYDLHDAEGTGLETEDPPAAGPEPVPPRHAALLAAARLTETHWRDPEALAALVEALRTIEPPSARLFVLDELRQCPTPPEASDSLVAPLRRVLPAPSGKGCPDDETLHQVLEAELLRLAGHHRRADRQVDSATPLTPGPDAEPLVWWRWAQAHRRIGTAIGSGRRDHLRDAVGRYPLLRAAVLLQLATDARLAGQPGQERQQVEEAAESSSQVQRPTRWAANALHRYAKLVDDVRAARTADSLYRRLGLPERGAEPGPEDIGARVPRDDPDQLRIRLRTPAGLAFGRPDALERLLREEPGYVVELMCDTLRRTLLPELARPPEVRALCLESDDLVVHSLPWELAVAELERYGETPSALAYRSVPTAADLGNVVRLQAVLRAYVDPGLPTDGLFGPRTREAFTRLTHHPADELSAAEAAHAVRRLTRHRPPDGRPQVVLVVPDIDAQHSNSSHLLSSLDLADVYSSLGFSCHLAESVDVRSPLPIPPSVVHVSAPLGPGTRGPHFDLSAPYSELRLARKSRGSDLSAPALARWLRAAPQCLVVLDPPFPGSAMDVPEQLLRRNLFAAELLTQLPGSAIFGLGLTDRPSRMSVGLLARTVTEGLPLDKAFKRLVSYSRAGSPGSDMERLAMEGIALFAAPATYGP